MIEFTPDFSTYLAWLNVRMEMVSIAIVAGGTLGAFFARGPFHNLMTKLRDGARLLAVRLDREHRGIATRVYRGIVALMMLVIPALAVAAFLSQPLPSIRVLTAILAILWFGDCFDTVTLFRAWRDARDGKLPLEIAGVDYLFPDGHGVIRHILRARLDAFAVGVVGVGFWYILAALPGALIYLASAFAATAFKGPVFGWAAHNSFVLLDALPRLIARSVLTIAALFAPGTRPFHALFSPRWPLFLARLMNVSLGGSGPDGDLPWVGDGTPRPSHEVLARALLTLVSATVLLFLLLNSPILQPIVKDMDIRAMPFL